MRQGRAPSSARSCDEHDHQRLRAMRAEGQHLLDVGGLGRAGDQQPGWSACRWWPRSCAAMAAGRLAYRSLARSTATCSGGTSDSVRGSSAAPGAAPSVPVSAMPARAVVKPASMRSNSSAFQCASGRSKRQVSTLGQRGHEAGIGPPARSPQPRGARRARPAPRAPPPASRRAGRGAGRRASRARRPRTDRSARPDRCVRPGGRGRTARRDRPPATARAAAATARSGAAGRGWRPRARRAGDEVDEVMRKAR